MKKVYTLLLLLGVLSIWGAQPAETYAAGNSMGCFIDTPAWDTYRDNACYLLGSTPSTASFAVSGPADYVIWSVSGCGQAYCNVPISPGQSVTVSAQVVVNGQVVDTVSATAYYFYEPGW